MQHIYADYCRPRRQTGRILDGKPAGYMRTLRALCSKQLGLTRQNRTPRNSSKSYRRRRVPGERERELERDILETGSNFAIDSLHPCSFIFSNNFADIFKRFHVLFRFRPGCETPKGVDCRIAWTSPRNDDLEETQTRHNRDLYVTYTTQDGRRTISDFVPVVSLELCPPGIQKKELALITMGDDAGAVVFPSRYAKDDKKEKVGIFCKKHENSKKRDEVMYLYKYITKLSTLEDGPPGN